MPFVILVCKLLAAALRLFGRGSSFPGAMALKLCPGILKKLKLPEITVAVTGSNGKTGTAELIYELAKKTGKTVICNSEGSNQIEGVTALFIKHASPSGKVKADIAVIESDERFCQYTFRYFAPTAIVITNLYRDQLTRNGHNEYVLDELKKGLPPVSTVILNADDPLSASVGGGRGHCVYFGIDPLAFRENGRDSRVCDDGRHCPVCGGTMEYGYRLHNHLGGYRCKNCSYARPNPSHSVTALSGRSLVIDGVYDIRPQMVNAMSAGNIAAAFTAGAEIFGLSGETMAGTLDGYVMKNGRVRRFAAGGHKGIFMLSKHENIMSYDGALEYIVKSRSAAKTVVIIFDRLSRKYSANDVSWLWDIDFELLKDSRVKKIILSGAFAFDLAARLEFAGIDADAVAVEPDISLMTESLGDSAIGEIFALTCFTDADKFLGRLKGGAA